MRKEAIMTTTRTPVTTWTTSRGNAARTWKVREASRNEQGWTECRTVRVEVEVQTAAGQVTVKASSVTSARSACEAAGV